MLYRPELVSFFRLPLQSEGKAIDHYSENHTIENSNIQQRYILLFFQTAFSGDVYGIE